MELPSVAYMCLFISEMHLKHYSCDNEGKKGETTVHIHEDIFFIRSKKYF